MTAKQPHPVFLELSPSTLNGQSHPGEMSAVKSPEGRI